MNIDKVKEGAVYPNCFWCSLSYLVWPRVLALGVALPKMDLKRKAFISEIRSTSHEVYTQAALRLDKRPYYGLALRPPRNSLGPLRKPYLAVCL